MRLAPILERTEMILRLLLLVMVVVLCGCSHCHAPGGCGYSGGGLEPPLGIHPHDVR
jgi:hypothetical protein